MRNRAAALVLSGRWKTGLVEALLVGLGESLRRGALQGGVEGGKGGGRGHGLLQGLGAGVARLGGEVLLEELLEALGALTPRPGGGAQGGAIVSASSSNTWT